MTSFLQTKMMKISNPLNALIMSVTILQYNTKCHYSNCIYIFYANGTNIYINFSIRLILMLLSPLNM